MCIWRQSVRKGTIYYWRLVFQHVGIQRDQIAGCLQVEIESNHTLSFVDLRLETGLGVDN